jgi:hypothetical protein
MHETRQCVAEWARLPAGLAYILNIPVRRSGRPQRAAWRHAGVLPTGGARLLRGLQVLTQHERPVGPLRSRFLATFWRGGLLKGATP